MAIRSEILALSLLAVTAGTACRSAGLYGPAGVTPGGAQDIGHARDLIERGVVPTRESFLAEGLFSEHDLPLDGGLCAETLCPQAGAVAWTPVDGAGEAVMAQLGFGSRFAAQGVARPPLELAVAVDVSGSMTGAPLDAVKAALHEVVDRLGEADRFALVRFDDRASVLSEMAPVTEREREHLHERIDQLRTDGGTDIEAGLALAINEVTPSAARSERVLLLTDAQPNVGATDAESFSAQARAAASNGVGLTVVGVGFELGVELAQEMSTLRGGNYVYLADAEAVEDAFADFDALVSPIAYDLQVEVRPAEGVALHRGWGAPVDADSGVSFGASTLFLSNRRGGMGLSFLPGPAHVGALAELSMTWEELDGRPAQAALQVARSEDPPAGPLKMAALADLVLALEGAADACYAPAGADGALSTEAPDAALTQVAYVRIDAARAHLEQVKDALGDDAGLAREIALLDALRPLLEDRRGCSAYSY